MPGPVRALPLLRAAAGALPCPAGTPGKLPHSDARPSAGRDGGDTTAVTVSKRSITILTALPLTFVQSLFSNAGLTALKNNV